MIETTVHQHAPYGVKDEADLRRIHRRRRGRLVRPGKDGLVALVNRSRWVAVCECGAAVAVTPGWDSCVCFGKTCGRYHKGTIFPEDVKGIEAALAPRLPANRNWHPGETVADLLAENKEHEVT